MLMQPWQYIVNIENRAIRCADRSGEGLEGDSAEIEGQAFECRISFVCSRESGASAGGVGGVRGPFAVRDLNRAER